MKSPRTGCLVCPCIPTGLSKFSFARREFQNLHSSHPTHLFHLVFHFGRRNPLRLVSHVINTGKRSCTPFDTVAGGYHGLSTVTVALFLRQILSSTIAISSSRPYSRLSYYSMFVIYTIIYLSLSVCLSVGVHKLQVAILARSSREMSLTVRIV